MKKTICLILIQDLYHLNYYNSVQSNVSYHILIKQSDYYWVSSLVLGCPLNI